MGQNLLVNIALFSFKLFCLTSAQAASTKSRSTLSNSSSKGAGLEGGTVVDRFVLFLTEYRILLPARLMLFPSVGAEIMSAATTAGFCLDGGGTGVDCKVGLVTGRVTGPVTPMVDASTSSKMTSGVVTSTWVW